MDPRSELEQLRKLKRLRELEAKAFPQAVQKPDTQGGAAQAALEGFGQTATMGYLPHIQAAIERFLPNPTAEADEKLKAMGIEPPSQTYLQARDENIARQQAQAKAHPVASALGKGAGLISSAALPIPGASLGGLTKGLVQGAITGAAYNPGDIKGEISPIQAQDRLKNAALGGGLGLAGAAIGKGVSALADKSRAVEAVKDSASLSQNVKNEIDAALQAVTDKEIRPKADALRELLSGKDIKVNTDLLANVDPKIGRIVKRASGAVDDAGLTTMSAKNAQRLKKIFDSEANYAASKPFDLSSAAKGEEAKKAADILRSKISGLDPAVQELNSSMSKAIRAREALSRSSRSTPIAAIRGTPGTDKGSLIDMIDKMAGSNLEKRSSQIDEAKSLLLDPVNLVKPLQLPNELRKLGVRAAAGTARQLEKLPNSTRALIGAILQAKK